jgi:signal peptidase II
MVARRSPAHWPSIVLFLLAFGLDRIHKFVQVSSDCIALGQSVCPGGTAGGLEFGAIGWHGGEYVPVGPFFDYVLVWNTGISYGLFTNLPVAVLGVLMVAAIIGLVTWWWRSKDVLLRAGLALCIGGAASNALDRWIYGAVADFFHFHYGPYSFYIFNLADTAITFGVILLILDFLGVGRRRNTSGQNRQNA